MWQRRVPAILTRVAVWIVSRAALDKGPPGCGRSMFDGVARRYDPDQTPCCRSARTDNWAASLPARRCSSDPGRRCWIWPRAPRLSTVELTKSGGVVCVAADFSRRDAGGGRGAGRCPRSPVDATRLPFGDGRIRCRDYQFRVAQTSPTRKPALREDGHAVHAAGRSITGVRILHSHKARCSPTAYKEYLMQALAPGGARAVSSNPEAYVYLAESIRALGPTRRRWAHQISRAGWSAVRWRKPDRGNRCAGTRGTKQDLARARPAAGSPRSRGSSGRSRRPGIGTPAPGWSQRGRLCWEEGRRLGTRHRPRPCRSGRS